MSFEKEVTEYYSSNFEIIDFGSYVDFILIVWTIVKFIFYVVPTLELIHASDREKIANTGVRPSKFQKFSRDLSVWAMLVPVLDCFVFFYIIISIVGRIEGLYPRTVIKYRIFGISAGILNITIISNFQNLLMYSSGMIFTEQSQFFLAFNIVIFAAWILLSVHHLFYLYSMNQEIFHKTEHPELFSDYGRDGHFTAQHL